MSGMTGAGAPVRVRGRHPENPRIPCQLPGQGEVMITDSIDPQDHVTPAQDPSMLAIRAGRAFDGRAARPGGALALCAGGQIVGVEPPAARAPDAGPGAGLPGATVLPGQIDAYILRCAASRYPGRA